MADWDEESLPSLLTSLVLDDTPEHPNQNNDDQQQLHKLETLANQKDEQEEEYGQSRTCSSDLPTDIMFLILDMLLEPIDHARFARVCKEWHSLAKLYNRERQLWRFTRPPMLYVPMDPRAHLYSVSETRIYNNVKLPVLDDDIRVYCGHGWVAEVEYHKTETSKYYASITLVNHFGNSRETIPLPSLIIDDLDPERFRCILSADPIRDRDNYVVIGQHNWETFSFKSGQECWKKLDQFLNSLSCVTYHEGRVYGINNYSNGNVVSYDVNSIEEKSHTYCLSLSQRWSIFGTTHLVISTEGDLLAVKTIFENDSTDLWRRIMGFRVYKLVLVGSTAELVEMNNIGDEALFVGENLSLSVLASKFPGCRPNSIYYTKDTADLRWMYRSYNIRDFTHQYGDVGVFNLQDKSITQHYPQSILKGLKSPAVWITPSFPVV